MSFINSFRAKLTDGGIRPTFFKVYVAFPSFIQNGALLTDDLGFLCRAASLPQSQITPIDVPFQGRNIKVAGERTFDPWSITVINTDAMKLHNAFEQWMWYINGNSTNQGLISPASYQMSIAVNQLDRDNNVIKRVELVNAFPTNVGEIALDYNSANQVSEFQVTFAYDYFRSPQGTFDQ